MVKVAKKFPALRYIHYNVLVKRPWVLKHNSLLILAYMGTYPGYKLPIFVQRLLHSPLETRYTGAYLGVGACPGHYGTYNKAYLYHLINDGLDKLGHYHIRVLKYFHSLIMNLKGT